MSKPYQKSLTYAVVLINIYLYINYPDFALFNSTGFYMFQL